MAFRRHLLALALPALALVVAGCNPPIDEAGKGGGAAPAVTDPAKPPVTESAPADVKPKTDGAMPTDGGAMSAPAPAPASAEKPADPPKTEEPKMEPPK